MNAPAVTQAAPLRLPLAWLLAIVAGCLVFTSFPFSTEPDSNIWVFGWFAFVPWFFALRGRSGRGGFWFGFLTGFVTNFGGFWWISEVLRDFGGLPPFATWPLTALNAAYQGLVFAIAGLLIARSTRSGSFNLWRVAAIFTVVEWLFPMLFPWFLGNGQYRFLPAIQVAELGGVPAVTFVMVVANGLLYRLLDDRLQQQKLAWRSLAPAALLVVASLVYGVVRVGMVENDMAAAAKLKLGLVEANIGIFEKEAKGLDDQQRQLTLHRNLLKHQEMSRELERQGADVIIWPESSYFPVVEPWIKTTDDFVLAVTPDGHLLTGDATPRQLEFSHAGLRHVSAAREDAWVAVGDKGHMLTARGAVTLPGEPMLSAATFLARDPRRTIDRATTSLDIVAIGAGGHVAIVPYPALKDGRTPTPPSSASLHAITPIAANTAIIVGAGGTIWRLEGGTLTAEAAPTSDDLHAVAWSRRDETVWAAGANGTVIHGRNGRLFQTVPGPGTATIHTLIVDADNNLWAASDDGVHVRAESGWIRKHRGRVGAMGLDARGDVAIALTSDDGRHLLRRATADGWLDLPAWDRAVTALTGLPYAQRMAFPRDVRWVWQSRAPLPPLALYDSDPWAELAGVPGRDLSPIQRGFKAPILFGGLTWEPHPERDQRVLYNTALMLDRDGRVIGLYDKVYLLAFGEYMPFGETFPELYDIFTQAGRFTPGEEVRVFDFAGHRIGIMICYEDILATFTNRVAREKPNIIINVTNDAWFGRTSEPHLHLALAVFRAVETRLVLVRSTNTGVSALIEPTGRISAQTRIDDPETLLVDAVMMAGGTLYSLVGHGFAWLLFLSLAIPAVLRRLRPLLARLRGQKV
jgi:apolipoprotein N-acyltransferase